MKWKIALIIASLIILIGIVLLFYKPSVLTYVPVLKQTNLGVTGFASTDGPKVVNSASSIPDQVSIINYNQDGYDYIANSSNFETYIKANSNYGDGVKSCSYLNGTRYCVTYQSQDYSYRDSVGTQDYLSSISGVTGNVSGNSITFENLYPNVSLKYSNFNSSLKENYIIYSMPRTPAGYLGSNVTLDFGGYINYANLSVIVNGTNMTGQNFVTDQEIDFVVNNTTLFYLPKPYAYDSRKQIINLQYEIHNQGSQIWFYVRTPYSWLNDSSRVFPVYIDPSLVQSAAGPVEEEATATTISATFSSPVTAGNTIILAITWGYPESISSITDTLGNIYYDSGATIYTEAMDQTTAIWYANNSLGGSDTITVTFGGSVPWRGLYAVEYSGLAKQDILDDTAANGATSGTADPGTITPTEDNELVFSIVSDNLGSGENPASGFTSIYNDSGTDLYVAHQIQTTATEITTFWSYTGNWWVASAASFKAETADSTSPIVNVNQPIDNYNTSSQTIAFNATAYDNVNVTNISLYGNWTGSWVANITNTTPVNNTLTTFIINNIPEGKYLWNALACDNSSNCAFNSSNRTFTVDATPPTITLPLYSNLTQKQNTETLTLNVSVSDSLTGLTGSACNIEVNGTNTTIAVSNGWCNTTTIPLTNLNNGNYPIRVYVNDSLNNLGLNDSYYVTLVSFLLWSNNKTNSTRPGSAVLHSVYWTDNSGLSGYIFSFDNGTGIFSNDSFASMTGNSNWSNVTKLINSTQATLIQWIVYANDSSNNWNSTGIMGYYTAMNQRRNFLSFGRGGSRISLFGNGRISLP